MHTKVKIPSFISSFGLGAVATGVAVLIYRGEPIRILDGGFRSFFTGWSFDIPNILIISLVVFLFLVFLQKKTVIGTYVDAIGGDEKLTRLNGIPVNKFKIISFGIAGFCYGIAGVILAARLGTGTAELSTGLLLHSIAAVLLGGTALQGGNGGVTRTLVGALIISSLKTGIIVLRINPYFQEGFIGIVLVIVLLLGAKRGQLVINK
ncbi:MAG: ABC transporter permease [Halanaerobiaceae bacterium]